MGDSDRLKIESAELEEFDVDNASNLEKLKRFLPHFEHSDKHRQAPYFDKVRNENVAAMPIRDEIEAGNLLRNGISFDKDIFSFDKKTERYFRFKPTRLNIFHGFEITKAEVPLSVLAQLSV